MTNRHGVSGRLQTSVYLPPMTSSFAQIKGKWSVAAKLGLSFSLLIGIVCFTDWLALRQISRADADLDTMVDSRWDRVQLAQQAQSYSSVNSRIILQALITADPNAIDVLTAQATQNSEQISQLIETLGRNAQSPEERNLLRVISLRRAPYQDSYRRALDLLTRQKDGDQARAIMVSEAMPKLLSYHQALNDYVEYQGRELDEAQAQNVRANGKTRREALLLMCLATLFAVAIAVFITRDTVRHMRRRIRAERKLQEARDQLETKVTERTAELVAANRKLELEAAERTIVEGALRQSEQRHRQIVDCASDTIYRINTDGHFTFVNPSAAAIVKRTVEDCRGLHFLDLVRDDFKRRAAEFYRQQIAERTLITYFEFPAVAADGSEVWIGQNVQLLMEQGRVVELQGIARDITTRKQIEEQLMESERRYRLLFESNPQPMWVFDAETLVFLAVNDAAVRNYGYSREEFLGMTIKEIRPKEEIERLFTRNASSVDGFGSYDSCTWHHRKKDGSIIEVEICWHTLEFAGRPAKLVLAQDVTERKRTEAEVRFQQAPFQQLFENAPLGIVRVDQSDRIVDANKEFQKIFQFSLEEIKDRPINEVIVPAVDRQEAVAFSARTLSGQAVKAEALRQRQDGTIVPVQIFGVPIVKDEAAVGVFAIYIDLSERKQAEAERSKLTEEIEAQRQRLNDILETLPCVVWEAGIDSSDKNPTPAFVNSYVERMYGYTVQEWLRTPDFWLSTVHPEDRPVLEKGNHELFARGSLRNELRWIKKDGRVVWGENQIVVVKDSAGDPVGVRGVTTDITDRKRVEAALRSSERKYRDIFTFAPVGIYQSLPDGTIVGANNALAALLGYESVEDLLQARLDRDIYLRPSERQKLINEYQTLAYVRDLEVQWKKRDGSLIWVELTAHAIKGSGGAIEYFEGFVHDVTNRKRMQDERQVISEIIQGVINTTDVNELLSLIHQSIARYLYAENCFVALYDDSSELMHFPFWVDKFDPRPEPRPIGAGFSSHVLRSGNPIIVGPELTEEMAARGEVEKSGSASASWLGVPLRTHQRTIGVLVVQHYEEENVYDNYDLEFLAAVGNQIALAIERKRAEQAVFEANFKALSDYEELVERIAALGQTLGTARELSLIFRALRDFAVASVPCDGMMISLYDRDRSIRKAAYCWADNQEFDPANLLEMPVKDGLTGRAIRNGVVIIENDFQPEIRRVKPPPVRQSDDHHIPRSALSAPMAVMGRIVGCVEIQSYRLGAYHEEHATAMRMGANLAANAIENVVLMEREQEKEQQLRQVQKMESIGTLAGGIAHDFNNLMTAVTGYSDLALRSVSDDCLRTRIEEIKKAGERAASLTRQLLAFSRKQMLQPKVLDLNLVVKGTAKMLTRVLGEDIDLRLQLDESLGQIKADPGQIEQVILNLSVNARDAMPRGGALTIKTENLRLNGRLTQSHLVIEPGDYVMMCVADTGCGMDDETKTYIFEPFFTTKEVGKGTGLGLATVYGIVKQSGGHILVYSEVDQGTTFRIYLPRVDETTAETEQEIKTQPAARGQETILLVEDEEIVRNLAREILQTYGYSVLTAANGHEGLRVGLEFEGPIDLMITDVVMPVMGGRDMAEKLKGARPDLRVLFMSGFTDDAILHHGAVDESVFFLQKPFSPEALARTTRDILDQN